MPSGKIYPLSIPEQKAMEEYGAEVFKQGYIHPSPAASSFFFLHGQEGQGLDLFSELDLLSTYNLIQIREWTIGNLSS